MSPTTRALSSVVALTLALSTNACTDPTAFDTRAVESANQQEEICAASSEWLPNTPPVSLYKPVAHPATECPFYRGGWQNFLLATQPDAQGRPALQAYATVDDLFTSATPHAQRDTVARAWLGDIKQAGGRQILIDGNGHSIYYGIHVNQGFADFINANNLKTADQVKNANPNLFFPAGVVEFKSAWQEVPDGDPSLDNYISTKAWVPHLRAENGRIIEDKNAPRLVTVRLLALHVVFTLPGHPEFIWSTFEHSAGTPDLTAADGQRDVAPVHPGDANPSLTDPNNQNDATVISMSDHILYQAGVTAQAGNQPIAEATLAAGFNEATQTFGARTSIYRMFPGSKSNTTHPDDAITSLNFNVETLFAQAQAAGRLPANDKRGHYRLVGAVWMDKPAYFGHDSPIQNDLSSPFVASVGQAKFEKDIRDNGSDSAYSILAGEDRLSSTAMESFTQAPDAFPNCFGCHNTQAITAKGVSVDRDSQGTVLIPPKLLNVSHVLSQFLLEESGL
ncbi:MAG TPA: hypothetical protein VGL59_07525 [Polyangia bacterium]|jgi:hypothetical protein